MPPMGTHVANMKLSGQPPVLRLLTKLRGRQRDAPPRMGCDVRPFARGIVQGTYTLVMPATRPASFDAPDAKTGHVHVVGYTDRLGSADCNQKLSGRRAATVRDYLVGRVLPRTASTQRAAAKPTRSSPAVTRTGRS